MPMNSAIYWKIYLPLLFGRCVVAVDIRVLCVELDCNRRVRLIVTSCIPIAIKHGLFYNNRVFDWRIHSHWPFGDRMSGIAKGQHRHTHTHTHLMNGRNWTEGSYAAFESITEFMCKFNCLIAFVFITRVSPFQEPIHSADDTFHKWHLNGKCFRLLLSAATYTNHSIRWCVAFEQQQQFVIDLN